MLEGYEGEHTGEGEEGRRGRGGSGEDRGEEEAQSVVRGMLESILGEARALVEKYRGDQMTRSGKGEGKKEDEKKVQENTVFIVDISSTPSFNRYLSVFIRNCTRLVAGMVIVGMY